ncbi:CBO2463/CBO2479 domain-containing protein [Peptacetobacter sp.]|uniref:CBO2463/CBO2479 domain-containing protein n=1 Tax=unclassified Peptacetobacter TaxID=2991974 RepID=UPI00261471A5|nr:CBO2463/CBO2479 domain-containing protein [Peptacetobacter sp.]MEE0451995.1 CBO2463/CBO2479 domain-containing protein [Peptacetobacter sp.]
MEKLRYVSSESYFEGVIVEIHDGAFTIDLKGRLGQFKIPSRMLITDYEPKIGQEVGFMLSYPEVLSPEPNPEYVANILREEKKKAEIQARTRENLKKQLLKEIEEESK